MNKLILPLFVVFLTMMACATPAQVAPPVNPAGIFDFTGTGSGSANSGTIEIEGRPGFYTGTVTFRGPRIAGSGRIGLASVAVDGQQMTVVLDAPESFEFTVQFVLVFAGDGFSGDLVWYDGPTVAASVAVSGRRMAQVSRRPIP